MTRQRSTPMSRRRFMQDATLASLTLSLSSLMAETLQAGTTVVPPIKRSNALSAEGKVMLGRYAEGVAKMKARKPYDPRSWIFQANIHDYPRGPASTKIFDPTPGMTAAQKAELAKYKLIALGGPGQRGVWATCSHFGYGEHFLTWHRIYLHYFEMIIASLIAKPFALPYWAYEKNANGARSLPAAFLSPADKSNPLWFEFRKIESASEGIQTDEEVSHADAYALTDLFRLGSNGKMIDTESFTLALEGTPHGAIHVAVGDERGMGYFTYAARDPIFWLHHCNIDRLWESWRRASQAREVEGTYRRDPIDSTFWKKWAKFPFADETGTWKEMAVLDTLNAAKIFKTEYEKYEPAPQEEVAMGFATTAAAVTVAAAAVTVAATTLSKNDQPGTAKITKEGQPVVVKLKPAVAPDVAFGFGAKAETKYTLVVDVETSGVTTAAHAAYLDILEQPGGTKKVKKLVKVFNMFGKGHGTDGEGGHEGHSGPIKATWKADVTQLVKNKVLDPLNPGDLTFKAQYGDPESPIEIKNYRIDAE